MGTNTQKDANKERAEYTAGPKRQPEMKTLIISGVYSVGEKVIYNVILYGQTDEKPLIQCITWFIKELNCYDELERLAREKFCQYFETDLNNIISLVNLFESPKCVLPSIN